MPSATKLRQWAAHVERLQDRLVGLRRLNHGDLKPPSLHVVCVFRVQGL